MVRRRENRKGDKHSKRCKTFIKALKAMRGEISWSMLGEA